jgi:hypothetical protein
MSTRDRILGLDGRGIASSFARGRGRLWLCLALALAGGCRQAPRGNPPAREEEVSDPAEVLRAAWDRVPLVALGEVHAIAEYGAFLESLIDGGEIANQVDDIVVEFGSADHQDIADRYVAGEPVPAADMERLLRDTTQLVVWDSPIYAKIFSAVRRANQRPDSRPIRVLLGDPPIDWAATKTAEDYRTIADRRDLHFAAVVEREVLAKRRRALLLFGAFHALKQGSRLDTAASLLEQRHPGSVFAVMLYDGMGPHTAQVDATLSGGPRPRIVLLSRSWIGSLPARSAFVLPPVLQIRKGLKLRDIADAYLYLGPAGSLTEASPPSKAYEDATYLRELERRYPIVFGRPLDTRQLLDREP